MDGGGDCTDPLRTAEDVYIDFRGRRAGTAEDVYIDFRGRRAGLLKALTTESEEFFHLCDPNKENLCLYGIPNETWELNIPPDEVPTELPEPALGINFARDGMDAQDWLILVAVHSDSWLLSVAFYFAARFGLNRQGRKKLFNMINSIPTLYEIVARSAKKKRRERTTTSGNKRNKSGSKMSRQSEAKVIVMALPKQQDGGEDNEEDDHEYLNTLCGSCGGSDDDVFWIFCDVCERWYHGKCVNITPTRAEHINQYKCPDCSNK